MISQYIIFDHRKLGQRSGQHPSRLRSASHIIERGTSPETLDRALSYRDHGAPGEEVASLGRLSVVSAMHDQVIQQALRDVQDILLATQRLPDDRTVLSLRAIMRKPEVKVALERANDTAFCFALRTIKRVLSEARQPPGTVINRLWEIIDELNRALGNSQIMVLRKKPPAA